MRAGDRVRVSSAATDLAGGVSGGRPSVHAGRTGAVAELLADESMTVLLDGDERATWFQAGEIDRVTDEVNKEVDAELAAVDAELAGCEIQPKARYDRS